MVVEVFVLAHFAYAAKFYTPPSLTRLLIILSYKNFYSKTMYMYDVYLWSIILVTCSGFTVVQQINRNAMVKLSCFLIYSYTITSYTLDNNLDIWLHDHKLRKNFILKFYSKYLEYYLIHWNYMYMNKAYTHSKYNI